MMRYLLVAILVLALLVAAFGWPVTVLGSVAVLTLCWMSARHYI